MATMNINIGQLLTRLTKILTLKLIYLSLYYPIQNVCQCKITRHVKRTEKTQSAETNHVSEVDSKVRQMLELSKHLK